MTHYKPLHKMIEVPYIPVSFISILAEIAEEGYLFPERAPIRIRVERQRENYLLIRLLDRNDVLALRFDTLEVWRENDCRLRYRVSYWGYLRAVPYGLELQIGLKWVLAAMLIVVYWHRGGDFVKWLGLSHDFSGPDTGASTLPSLRPIAKRLKEIAVNLPP